MSVEILKYRDWAFEVDKLQTQKLYSEVNLSGTEKCSCGQCKDFLNIREDIYPSEIRELFKNLGIDINKEFELCDYGDEKTGRIYSWWFHFVGKILEGDDCNVPSPNGGYTMQSVAINDFFQIGFTKNISISFFDNYEDLIQVELWADLPWSKSDALQVIKNQESK